MPRGERMLMLGLAASALVLASLDGTLGACSGALHLAPVACIFLPLLLGLFPGETLIARLAGRSPARRRARARAVLVPRGVPSPRRLLLAWDLAVRPPPQALAART